MIQHHTEFFSVERKKLIWVFISVCLFVICLSGASSFNNSFTNKQRKILTAKHLVHSQGRSCSIYGCEKGHQKYFLSGTALCVVTYHFTNFSYLCVTIASVIGVGGTFGPTVPQYTSYSATLGFVRRKEIKNNIAVQTLSGETSPLCCIES